MTKRTIAVASPEYEAELRDWAFKSYGEFLVGFGRVYGDKKARWPDGFAIATSAMVHGRRRAGAVITTRNTVLALWTAWGSKGAA